MKLLCCQVAGGLWTGLGWAMPRGGQTFIRPDGPPKGCGWGSRGHYQDNTGWCVSRLMGSDPRPRFQIMWGSCLKVCRATYRCRHRMISAVDKPSVLLFAT